jgi:hypothetical protein
MGSVWVISIHKLIWSSCSQTLFVDTGSLRKELLDRERKKKKKRKSLFVTGWITYPPLFRWPFEGDECTYWLFIF